MSTPFYEIPGHFSVNVLDLSLVMNVEGNLVFHMDGAVHVLRVPDPEMVCKEIGALQRESFQRESFRPDQPPVLRREDVDRFAAKFAWEVSQVLRAALYVNPGYGSFGQQLLDRVQNGIRDGFKGLNK